MLFIANKYTRWYYDIVNHAKTRILDANQYVEKHHIIPRSLGGNNCKMFTKMLGESKCHG